MDLIINDHYATWGKHTFPCTHGRNGFTDNKREGDGMTPVGSFVFRQAFWRPDRLERPQTQLPLSAITESCGWCDDPGSPDYNRYVTKPYAHSHEDLWLENHIYDLIIVVGHNDTPVIPGLGSAIFIHLKSPDLTPTAGCIGLEQAHLLRILKEADTASRLIVSWHTLA